MRGWKWEVIERRRIADWQLIAPPHVFSVVRSLYGRGSVVQTEDMGDSFIRGHG